MPFSVGMVVGLIGVVIAVAVWWRTRRLGAVVGVLVAAFVVMAIADQSVLSSGGKLVGDILNWIKSNVLQLK